MGCSISTEKSPKARRKSRSPREHPDSCVNPEIRITRSDSTSSSSSSSSSSSDSSKSRGIKKDKRNKDKRNKKHRKKSKKDRKKSRDNSGECEKQKNVCENDPDDKPTVCVMRPEVRLPELELKEEKHEVVACDLQPEPETNNTEEPTPCKEEEAQPGSERSGDGNDTKPESDTEAKPELD